MDITEVFADVVCGACSVRVRQPAGGDQQHHVPARLGAIPDAAGPGNLLQRGPAARRVRGQGVLRVPAPRQGAPGGVRGRGGRRRQGQ